MQKIFPKQIVLFSGDENDHVCPVLRVVKPAELAGIKVVQGNKWISGSMHIELEHISTSDLVVIQRDFPSAQSAYEEVVQKSREFRKCIVYDLDDLLIDLPEDHPDQNRYEIARMPILEAIVEADMVTVASAELKAQLSNFNHRIIVLHNYLDDTAWEIPNTFEDQESDNDSPISIGYLGSHSHAPDLEMILPVLVDLLEKFGNKIQINFWGIVPPEILTSYPNVTAETPGYISYVQFANYFAKQNCDICIAPLKDNRFNRCKSELKFLEYSSKGFAGVYADLEPYRNVVKHGENGYLASSLENWRDYLIDLVDNSSRRRIFGRNAQSAVREKYLLSDHAQEWRQVYSEVLQQGIIEVNKQSLRHSFKIAKTWYRQLEDRVVSNISQLENQREAYVSIESNYNNQRKGLENLQKSMVMLQEEFDILASEKLESEQQSELQSEEIRSLNKRLEESKDQIYGLEAHINAITSGLSWELVSILRRFRSILIPHGSLRERFYFRLTRFSFSILKAFINKIKELFSGNRYSSKPSSSTSQHLIQKVAFTVEPGQLIDAPAFSLLVPVDKFGQDALNSVTSWLLEQTITSVEVVVWAARNGEAWLLGKPNDIWKADNWKTLRAGLRGRYLVIVDELLLCQAPTYLETNLIALETEELLFTINVQGNPRWIQRGINSGYLPGSDSNPFALQAVRVEIIQNDFKLNLGNSLLDTPSALVGKIITHTGNRFQKPPACPIRNLDIEGYSLRLAGRHILVETLDRSDSGAIVQISHPVETILEDFADPASNPTLLMLMPFLAMGGAERLHLHILDFLKDQFRFIVATVEDHEPSKGTMIDEFRAITPYVYIAQDFLEPHLLFSFISYLIRKFDVDILYIANGANWIYDALPHLKNNFPDLRVVGQVYHEEVGWIGRYNSSVTKSIDCHIGGTPSICTSYIDRGVKTGDIYQIEHAIEMDEVDPANYPLEKLASIRAFFGIPPENKVVAFIARLHPQKRPMDFVELARRYQGDQTITFLMVGDGPQAPIITETLNKMPLDNIVRSSFYSPISDIYAVADVLVIPSEYEATPLVLLESQAMGVAVVATDVGNIADVLEYSGGGVIVESIGDVEKLMKALEQALAMPLDPEEMRRKIQARYSLPIISEKFRNVFIGEKNE